MKSISALVLLSGLLSGCGQETSEEMAFINAHHTSFEYPTEWSKAIVVCKITQEANTEAGIKPGDRFQPCMITKVLRFRQGTGRLAAKDIPVKTAVSISNFNLTFSVGTEMLAWTTVMPQAKYALLAQAFKPVAAEHWFTPKTAGATKEHE